VCPEEAVPPDTTTEDGFRALMVPGPIPFETTGVLAALATPLAKAGISIFAIATYDTDYVLVREQDLARALEALQPAPERRLIETSNEGAVTGDGFADDQILHLIGAFVGVQRLGIGEETRDIVVGDDAVAAQDLAAP